MNFQRSVQGIEIAQDWPPWNTFFDATVLDMFVGPAREEFQSIARPRLRRGTLSVIKIIHCIIILILQRVGNTLGWLVHCWPSPGRDP